MYSRNAEISNEIEYIMRSARDSIMEISEEITDETALEIIEGKVLESERLALCGIDFQRSTAERIFYSLRKDLDILQPYADDPAVSEIMVNGRDCIFIERNGVIEKTNAAFESEEALEEVIRRICMGVHREVNELNPIVDARLSDGSRVNAVYKNIAINGPTLTIRKFPKNGITMEDLIQNETISAEAAQFLQRLVEAGYNIFISGGTSSGKTTFLNVLSDYIPKEERVIVIEDSAELQIRGIQNIVRLECRNANVQGIGEVDMRKLIKASLRMRPNRIIVGEVRGKEVMDMIQAMNTGHDGSLSTGHGNSIDGMLRRLESMFLQAADFPIEAIRSQIAEGIDIIVHLARLSGRRRKVIEIAEIRSFAGGANMMIEKNTLYKYKAGEGLIKTSNRLEKTEKLQLKGICLP